MMEALSSSETSILTGRYIQVDASLYLFPRLGPEFEFCAEGLPYDSVRDSTSLRMPPNNNNNNKNNKNNNNNRLPCLLEPGELLNSLQHGWMLRREFSKTAAINRYQSKGIDNFLNIYKWGRF
jgi:hypothetical protein